MLSNDLSYMFCYLFANYKTYLFNINTTHHERIYKLSTYSIYHNCHYFKKGLSCNFVMLKEAFIHGDMVHL